ncbi:hypothetical protein WJX82_004262 [Trebouxia sp. C0006]
MFSELHSLQLGEKHRNLFTRIPARLQFPVETVVDNQNRLLGCILLGFTAEGHHLLSYTSTHGYRVQIWRFLWGQQAELLAEIDLFGGTSEIGSDSSDDDIFASTDLPTSMAVSITETADQRLLIVHGCPDSSDADDALADAMNHVTVVPHPCTQGLSLQGFHFKANDDSGFSAAVTADLMGPAFDPERFIMACIPHDKLNSHRLVDYTVQQVLCGDDTDRSTYGLPNCKGSSCPLSTQAGWSLKVRACNGEAWAVVLIAAVFQPRTGAGQETVTPVTFVVNICSASGTGELLSELWMDAAKFQHLMQNLRLHPNLKKLEQADLQRVGTIALAERLAGKLKLKHSIPTSPHMRPVVLNNRAMLSSGRSAGLLTHPLLPICILGYGQHGTA